MLHNEVPLARRLVQVGAAIFWCLLSGGPIFGFAALKPVLINEGIYEDICYAANSTMTDNSISSFGSIDYLTTLTLKVAGSVIGVEGASTAACTAQDLKLNMMFTVGAVTTNISALVIGRILDVKGPRVCCLIGSFFLYIACAVFIFAKQLSPYFDPYLVGYGAMALGGPFCYMSSFNLSNAFPQYSGSILALITGAFDASSAVFLIYKLIYVKLQTWFTLDKFFKAYLFVPTFITLCQFFIMYGDSYKAEGSLCDDAGEDTDNAIVSTPNTIAEVLDENTHLVPSTSHKGRRDSMGDAILTHYASEGEAQLIKQTGGIFGVLHGYSASYQIKTPWFALMAFYVILQMLRLNYFVATIHSQYVYLFNSIKKADKINKYFDIMLPLGGVISVPFVGMLLDNFSTEFVLFTLMGSSVFLGVCGLLRQCVIGYINVSLFVVFRPLFYTVVSDFCAKVFGFETFGTVYGLMMTTSGVFNYYQSYLDKLTHTTFQMNPIPINLVLTLATVVFGGSLLAFVVTQIKKRQDVVKDGHHHHHHEL
ncbi:uncharacterized protein KQ657_000183 [Scheffersomyces spartinae]|uniref:Protein FMP42 n=1 Tax=Scheffersomyces spartinae TaxID=45513 RepID=A0A9P8AKQ3_9ASCO|nr:uncharacterized protein KQ657_000183 [Scheffersomyces spartinae]KAG7196171.1 hypothetical protein KQ657_000183 [Scheffersomyces spartinae]